MLRNIFLWIRKISSPLCKSGTMTHIQNHLWWLIGQNQWKHLYKMTACIMWNVRVSNSVFILERDSRASSGHVHESKHRQKERLLSEETSASTNTDSYIIASSGLPPRGENHAGSSGPRSLAWTDWGKEERWVCDMEEDPEEGGNDESWGHRKMETAS